MWLTGSAVFVLACLCAVDGFFHHKPPSTSVRVVTIHDAGEIDHVHSSNKFVNVPFRVDRCERNEVWYSCLPSCPITCANLFKTCRVSTRCYKGCECKRGYARRTDKGPCERVDRCPAIDDDHSEEETCSKNEMFTECGNSCSERCDAALVRCPAVCRKGCFCKKNYARIDGRCVRRSQCRDDDHTAEEETCPRHEEYTKCGKSCDEKCDKKSSSCSSKCRAGCFCKKGYVRIDGRCVSRDICREDSDTDENHCPRHEEYKTCGKTCDERCKGLPCSTKCKAGCFCEKGYVRVDGRCVRKDICKDESKPEEEKCPRHEKYNSCGRTCTESCDRDRIRCSSKCKAGCFCEDGLVRIDGKCVSEDKCKRDPPSEEEEDCPKDNEMFKRCGKNCEETCDPRSAKCERKCRSGCFCKPGYVRVKGKCVEDNICGEEHHPDDEDCPKRNEKYKRCGKDCEETCDPKSETCERKCRSGCFCEDGFVRVAGKCVSDDICRNDPEPPGPFRPVDPPGPVRPQPPPGPVRPVDPPGPVRPVDPPGPVRPVDPPGPVRPVDPPGPVRPVDPPGPVRPVDPPGPVRPVDPPGPVRPQPPGPVRPVDPPGPVRPVDPPGPVRPVDPPGPVRPVDPPGPFRPVDPPGPVRPVDPPGPVRPVEPPRGRPRTSQNF